MREGRELVFVERIAGTGAVPVLTRVGGRFALTATGVGLVLLAHAPADVCDEVLAGPVRRFTAHTMTDPDVLRAVLADVRACGFAISDRQGFAISDRQVTDDALSVAAPVHGRTGRVIAAVSVVVRYGTAPPHALVPLVRNSSRSISHALL